MRAPVTISLVLLVAAHNAFCNGATADTGCDPSICMDEAGGLTCAGGRCCSKGSVYGPDDALMCCPESNMICKEPSGELSCCPWKCSEDDGACCPKPTFACPSSPLGPVKTCCNEGDTCLDNECCPKDAHICSDYNDLTRKVCCKEPCTGYAPTSTTTRPAPVSVCCPPDLKVFDSAGTLIGCCGKELLYGPADSSKCCLPPNSICTGPDGEPVCCSKPCNRDGSCCAAPLLPCSGHQYPAPITACCQEGWCFRGQCCNPGAVCSVWPPPTPSSTDTKDICCPTGCTNYPGTTTKACCPAAQWCPLESNAVDALTCCDKPCQLFGTKTSPSCCPAPRTVCADFTNPNLKTCCDRPCMPYGKTSNICCPRDLIAPDPTTGTRATCCLKDKLCVNPITGAKTCCSLGNCVNGECVKCDLTTHEICPGPARACCPKQTKAGQAVCLKDGTCCLPPKTWCGAASYSLLPPPNVLIAEVCCDACLFGTKCVECPTNRRCGYNSLGQYTACCREGQSCAKNVCMDDTWMGPPVFDTDVIDAKVAGGP